MSNVALAQSPDQPLVLVFDRQGAATNWAYTQIALGAVLVVGFVVLFLLSIANDHPGKPAGILPGIGGGMGVLVIAMVGNGIRQLRAPRRVTLSAESVVVEWPIRPNEVIRWEQLASVVERSRDSLIGAKIRTLHLLDHRHSDLIVLPASFNDYEGLKGTLQHRVRLVHGDAATKHDAMEAEVSAKASRRQSRWGIVACLGLLLMFGSGLAFGLYERAKSSGFATRGERVEATLDRVWMRSVTPWVSYHFIDRDGVKHSRETSIKPEAYALAQRSPTITVEYLRDDPEWNRLASGETAEPLGTGMLLGLGAICLFAIAGLFVMGFGYDLRYDRGWRLTQNGQVLWGQAILVPDAPAALPDIAPPITSAIPANAVRPPPAAAPSGIIALGWVAIVFGLLGFLWHAFGLFVIAVLPSTQLAANAEMRIEFDLGAFLLNLFDLFLSLALIVCGIGLVRRRLWAAKEGLIIGALQVISSLVALGRAALVWRDIDPAMLESEMRSTVIASLIGATLFPLLTMIFPIVLVMILARRSVRERLDSRKAS